MRSEKVTGGDGEPDRGEVWTLGCGSEKDGGPATRRRRREGQGRAWCLRGLAGIKDGLGVLMTPLCIGRNTYRENDET